MLRAALADLPADDASTPDGEIPIGTPHMSFLGQQGIERKAKEWIVFQAEVADPMAYCSDLAAKQQALEGELEIARERFEALDKAEVKAEASKTGKAAGALGAAGFAGYMAVLFLSICLWWALGNLIGNGWSALVVTVLWGIVAAVLYASGRKKLREVNPTPERTVDTLKNVPDALKGEAGGHR